LVYGIEVLEFKNNNMTHIDIKTDQHGVASIMINRPDKRNAMKLDMWIELRELFAQMHEDIAVRTVILTGAGGYFCAGADISEFEQVRSNAEQGKVYDNATDSCVDAIMNCSKPTIAAITGFCVGGGMSLAMACDFRFADKTARFAIPAARLSIVYGTVDTLNLLNLVGLSVAKRILFSAEKFDAQEAYRLKFINKLADGDVLESARSFASTLAGNAPLSLSAAKEILNALAETTNPDLQSRVDQLTNAALESADYKEGVQAFAQKRQPQFKGV